MKLNNFIRGEDVVCRYGGEEFLSVLPEAKLDVAMARAEAIRCEVENNLKVEFDGQLLPQMTLL
jgi:diguanylate cyclase (GGDEF)-like protein